jgi:4-amino-4-deoxy-L-arabinose transferase-like glycosyltransferase
MSKNIKQALLLVFLAYLYFMLGNSTLSLTNPDEVFYTQTAKEMVRHNSWATPYLFDKPQFEKPIFTYWLLRIGFIIFGVTDFSARFFPALFAMLGVLAVYLLGLAGFKDRHKSFLSALVLMSGGLYLGLARTVFTDMIFSVCVLLSLTAFFWGYASLGRKAAGNILFFIFCGLAVLAKGPLGLLIPLLVVFAFLLVENDLKFISCKSFGWGFILFLSIALPWYILMEKEYGRGFTYEFFYNDHFRRIIEAEHAENDTWYYYPLAMVGCMFPWSLFVAASLIAFFKNIRKRLEPFYVFLACWIAVVLLLFQPAHSKLTSYIFPLFPALALLTGDFILNKASSKTMSRVFLAISIATACIFLLMPIGLIFAMAKYSSYVTSKIPVYGLIACLWALSLFMLFLILRKKILKAVYLLFVSNLLFLFFVPFVRNDVEPYVSCKYAVKCLFKDHRVDNPILCSKFFVRGVRYYTDGEVAVIDIPGKQFFSPHPIPFLDSDVKVKEFFLKYPVTYCILKKSSVDDIDRVMGVELKRNILAVVGDKYVVEVSQAQK